MYMSSPLCRYSKLFGNPGEGIHKYRFMGISILDVLVTIIIAIFIAWVMKWPLLYTIIGFFLLGILVHRMFCVRTAVDKLLFGDFGVETAKFS